MNVAASTVPFLIGFVGGFAVALFLRRLGGDRAEIFRHVLGLAILIVVGLGTWTSFQSAAQLEQLARCQNESTRAISASQATVRDAADRQDRAQREFSAAQLKLLTTSPTATLEERQAALAEYTDAVSANITALDQLIASRAAHPMPAPTLCGRTD